ncbi:hypothetical protein GCM10018965_019140 [Nonomuraea roseola]
MTRQNSCPAYRQNRLEGKSAGRPYVCGGADVGGQSGQGGEGEVGGPAEPGLEQAAAPDGHLVGLRDVVDATGFQKTSRITRPVMGGCGAGSARAFPP